MLIVEQVPFGGWRHHLCPGGKRVTGFSVAQGLPTNPVPLPPQLYWGHYGYWAAAAMEIMTVTVITVCAADRRHIYSSPKAIPPPFEPTCQGQAEPSEPFEPGSPRGLYHSSSPQGSSEILSRRMYTFSVSYSICSDQRVTARMRSWVRAHSRRMKVTLSQL